MTYLSYFRSALALAGLCTLGGLFLNGCGGSDDNNGGDNNSGGNNGGDHSTEAFVTYEGTYEITSYLLNEDACDPGSAALDTLVDTYMIAYSAEFFGFEFLTFASCSDLDDCAEKRIKVDNEEPFAAQNILTFDAQLSEDLLKGGTARTGSSQGETCTGRRFTRLDLSRSGNQLTIKTQDHDLEDASTDADGFCTVDAREQEKEAEGVPCSRGEIFELSKVE